MAGEWVEIRGGSRVDVRHWAPCACPGGHASWWRSTPPPGCRYAHRGPDFAALQEMALAHQAIEDLARVAGRERVSALEESLARVDWSAVADVEFREEESYADRDRDGRGADRGAPGQLDAVGQVLSAGCAVGDPCAPLSGEGER